MVIAILALVVTRHLCATGPVCPGVYPIDAGAICVNVGDIDPLSESVVVEPINGGSTTAHSTFGEQSMCIPLCPPRLGQTYYRARECKTVEDVGHVYVSTCGPWVNEVELSCTALSLADGALVVGGCNPEMYHVGD